MMNAFTYVGRQKGAERRTFTAVVMKKIRRSDGSQRAWKCHKMQITLNINYFYSGLPKVKGQAVFKFNWCS